VWKRIFLRRDIAQRVIERGDPHFGPLAAVGDARLGMNDVIGDEARIGRSETRKTGVDDGLVFLAHRIGDGEDIFLRRLVISVLLPVLDIGG